MLGFLRQRKRRKAQAEPFPAHYRTCLDDDCVLYRLLPVPDRDALDRLTLGFLAEKHFEGCGGLKVKEKMKVLIAAQACLLLLRRDTDLFPGLDSILIYPNPYQVPMQEQVAPNVVEDELVEHEGESWEHGSLVLAWETVIADSRDILASRNVVLHEFAHQLDAENGESDGVPLLTGATRKERRDRAEEWNRIMAREFQGLCDAVEHDRETFLDPYGASNTAEFFAVSTETFFTDPHGFRREHPELYALLCSFYVLDPTAFIPPDQ